MTPLKNPKHEAFVHNYLKCGDATEAFALTGYTRDSANAHRLLKRPQVQARLRELQDEIAAKVPITIESLIGELEEARQHATGKNQFAAAIKAILGKAQLAGLLVERSKVEVTNTSPFAGLEDSHEIGLKMVDGWLEFKIAAWADYREEHRQYLADLFMQRFDEVNAEFEAYVAEIHARPKRAVNLKALPSPLNSKDDSQPTTGLTG
jgi:terminase small subunit-like protein